MPAESAPYLDGLVLKVLRAEFGADAVGSLQPVDVLARLPYVVTRSIPGGGQSPDDRFAVSRGAVQVDCYAADRPQAFVTADGARRALIDAWSAQTAFDGQTLTRVRKVSGPIELRSPGQVAGFARVTATYLVTARA